MRIDRRRQESLDDARRFGDPDRRALVVQQGPNQAGEGGRGRAQMRRIRRRFLKAQRHADQRRPICLRRPANQTRADAIDQGLNGQG
jgi:hypothetical protein